MLFLLKMLRNLGKRLPENFRRKLKLSWIFKRLAKFISFLAVRNHSAKIYDCEIRHLQGNSLKFCLDLSLHNQRVLYLNGVYESNVTKLFSSVLDEGSTVVDVGAYIGYYSVIASLYVGNQGRVLSFEPDSKNFDQLSKTIAANKLENVSLYKLALSDKIGENYLRLSTDPATHSLANAGNGNFFKGKMKQTGEAVRIKTATLDKILEEEGIYDVDAVKVDVEGAELMVFKGMRKTLQQNDNLIIFCDVHENKFPAFGYSVSEFYRFLKAYGLDIFRVQHNELKKIDYPQIDLPDQYTLYMIKS